MTHRVPPATLIAALAAQLVLVVLIAGRMVSAGVEWHYIDTLSARPILTIVVIACPALLAIWAAFRSVEHREVITVGLCAAGGVVLQLALFRVGPHSLATLMKIDNFNIAAAHYDVQSVLRHYQRISPDLPLHARANMPGKILFFQLLRHLTTSPERIGDLVVLIACSGSLLVYGLARRLAGDRRVALGAMFLYFVLPARTAYFASLNTITPLFSLAILILLMRYLDRSHWLLPIALGALLFAAVLFEPSVLLLLPMFGVLIVQRSRREAISTRSLVNLVVVSGTTFLTLHALMLVAFDFNLFAALARVRRDAEQFNTYIRPDYARWLLPNLREFAVSIGLIVALLTASAAVAASTRRALRRSFATDPIALVAVCIVVEVTVLDVLGFNRGEVSRLWIFLAVYCAIVAARECIDGRPSWVFPAVFVAVLAQTVLMQRLVGFDVTSIFEAFVKQPMPRNLTVVLDVGAALIVALTPVADHYWRRADSDGVNVLTKRV